MNLAQQLAEQTGTVLKTLLGPLRAEIAALKKHLDETPGPKDGQPGKDGRDGVDGKSIEVGDVAPLIDAAVTKAVSQIPVPADGKSVTVEDVQPMVAELIGKAVAELPTPENGKDADPELVKSLVAESISALPAPAAGRDGIDGQPGKDADPEVVRALVLEAVSAIPAPKDGTDGKSVSVDDVQPLVAAEVEKAIAAMPKPQDGKSVPMEEVERMVAAALTKAMEVLPRPADGRDGRDGKEGAPGRDALDIEVLPVIDAEKEYGRNTWARHNGGLWRAFKNTVAMDGWECVVDGVAAIDVEQAGERGCSVVVRHASGKELRKEFAIPMVIDRGVFRMDSEYAKGDGCTWGGSFFISQKDGPTGKPGESDDWRLSVKRGRDGKDGRNGIDMTKAVSL